MKKKIFYKRFVITSKPAVYTTPNTGKFARVKGWAKSTNAALHVTTQQGDL